jgi:hypothetical protein
MLRLSVDRVGPADDTTTTATTTTWCLSFICTRYGKKYFRFLFDSEERLFFHESCQDGLGTTRDGSHWQAEQGKARQSKARHGTARQGKARQSKIEQGRLRQGGARQSKAGRGRASKVFSHRSAGVREFRSSMSTFSSVAIITGVRSSERVSSCVSACVCVSSRVCQLVLQADG